MTNIEKLKELDIAEKEYIKAIKNNNSFLEASLKAINRLFLLAENEEEKADEQLLDTITLISNTIEEDKIKLTIKKIILDYSHEVRINIKPSKKEVIQELIKIYNNYDLNEESFLEDSTKILKEVFLLTDNNEEDPEDCLQTLFFLISNNYDDLETTLFYTHKMIELYLEELIEKVELENEKNNE